MSRTLLQAQDVGTDMTAQRARIRAMTDDLTTLRATPAVLALRDLLRAIAAKRKP